MSNFKCSIDGTYRQRSCVLVRAGIGGRARKAPFAGTAFHYLNYIEWFQFDLRSRVADIRNTDLHRFLYAVLRAAIDLCLSRDLLFHDAAGYRDRSFERQTGAELDRPGIRDA